jgi:hypothetical protein
VKAGKYVDERDAIRRIATIIGDTQVVQAGQPTMVPATIPPTRNHTPVAPASTPHTPVRTGSDGQERQVQSQEDIQYMDDWEVRPTNAHHKAFMKSIAGLDKVTPNTKSRKLQDYLADLQFHASLHYPDSSWVTDPIAVQAIVMTTFNLDLKRLFLTQQSYMHSTWATLTKWLTSHTDQAPCDNKLQALEKLRSGHCTQGKRSLGEYNVHFQQLLHTADMNTPQNLTWIIQTYITGLNSHIRDQVWMNPLTNKHWESLQECQECAYRLAYQAYKSGGILNVMQGANADSRGNPSRGRGRGGRGGGRGRNRGREDRHRHDRHTKPSGHGPPVDGSLYPTDPANPGVRGHTNPPGTGHPDRGHNNPPGSGQSSHTKGIPHYYQPKSKGSPSNVSQVNRTMFTNQEELLRQKGFCPTCITSTCPSLQHRGQCSMASTPVPIWQAPFTVINKTGLRLSKSQIDGQAPKQ